MSPLTALACSMDYNGVVDSARAGIQMTHASNGPTVSLAEAQRLERESAEHLLKARKLSLIVDLDQTIVHATVDPTVGDWIAEGEAWEAKQRKKTRAEDRVVASESNGDGEVNPNWDALKDVKRFRLAADAVTRAGPAPRTNALTSVTSTNKAKVPARVAEDGAVYYIKPR
jgi:RNA polymerase II subunit A-like phosphatase